MNESNSQKEESLDYQYWVPHLKPKPIRLDDFFGELSAPAGFYNSVLSKREKLSLAFKQKVSALINETENVAIFQNSDDIPLPWQRVAHFLFENGMISSPKIAPKPVFNDEPKIYGFSVSPLSVDGLTDGNTNLNYVGSGASLDASEALSKAIGEFLERYSLTIYKNEELFEASISDLKNRNLHFLNPFMADIFSQAQKQKYPNRNFNDKSAFRWASGKSLMTGGKALIPAQMVFWNYRFLPDEPYIREPNTNGKGGMFTLEEAILSGLYELVQRDTFLIYWLRGIAPRRIDKDSIKSQKLIELLRDIDRYNIRIEILDITSDLGIPAFAAVLIDKGELGPAVSLAASCGLNPEVVMVQAVVEAMVVRNYQRHNTKLLPPRLPDFYEPFSLQISRSDRIMLWAKQEMKSKIDFFLGGPMASTEECCESLKANNPQDELRNIAGLFRKKGEEYEIFYYEAKHAALEALGYHAVSVSVPALTPLYLYETNAPAGAKRIGETLNFLPHPFP